MLVKHIKRVIKNNHILYKIAKKAKFRYQDMFYSAPSMLEGERTVFRAIYSQCDVIFDVGARYDVDYIEISKGNSINYHLFEINPKFFRILEKNIKKYENTENIIINNVGIAERDGSAHYYNDSQSILQNTTSVLNSAEKSKFKYPLRSISNYCAELGLKKIDFLKTDIEEYDFFALLGAQDLLFTMKYIQFELGLGADYLDRKVTARDYFDLLENNYSLYIVKDENNPLWKTNSIIADLVTIDDDFLKSKLSQGKYGIGYNILAINKEINVRDLNLTITNFQQAKYEEIIENFMKL